MHLRRLAILGFLALSALPGRALAAPQDVTRQPDMELAICADHETCRVRAVGDFDGDGRDDLWIEAVDDRNLASRNQRGANQPAMASSQIDLFLAPFDKLSPLGQLPRLHRATSTVFVEGTNTRPWVKAQDLDGDGKMDLLVTTSRLQGNRAQEAVHVFLGSRGWWNSRRVVGATGDSDIVIQRHSQTIAAGRTARASTQLQAHFGDVDGDGRLDLVWGSDVVLLEADASGLEQVDFEASEVDVMTDVFGRPELDILPGSQVEIAFRSDLRFSDFGACDGVLAGLGDLDADGRDDIVARSCSEDEALPDQLRVLKGAPSDASGRWIAPPLPGLGLFGGGMAGLDQDRRQVVPRPGNRGYLALQSPRGPHEGLDRPFFLTDVSGDGVKDIVLPSGVHTHIWLGGPRIAERVASMQSDRIFLRVGFGMTSLSRSWAPRDLDGDGQLDLYLAMQRDAEPHHGHGTPTRLKDPNNNLDVDFEPGARFYLADWQGRQVLDTRRLEPEALWNGRARSDGEEAGAHVWAMGDFNGDGIGDLLLATGLLDAVKRFQIVHGPF